ncbi:MAG: hypothetical protein KAT77_04730 [Nanoarchaeota archaeon]|nr:hypothetical protein [Nanoarchaeota archaeon]
MAASNFFIKNHQLICRWFVKVNYNKKVVFDAQNITTGGFWNTKYHSSLINKGVIFCCLKQYYPKVEGVVLACLRRNGFNLTDNSLSGEKEIDLRIGFGY